MATSSISTTSAPPASGGLALVVMGVSGAGKTTVGQMLAQSLGAQFIDGDDLHTDQARAKMHAGVPLTDEDRWPWLDRVGGVLAAGLDAHRATIVACSALRRAYRDRLRHAAGPALRFIYLAATPEAMRRRVGGRTGHYMPASLVDSQFGTLEEPTAESDVIEVRADEPPAVLVEQLRTRLAG
jgi:gluconokinase